MRGLILISSNLPFIVEIFVRLETRMHLSCKEVGQFYHGLPCAIWCISLTSVYLFL